MSRSISMDIGSIVACMAVVCAAFIETACEQTPDASEDTGLWGAIEIIEDLRIGTLEGPDEYMFGRIEHVSIGHDGSIYISDVQRVLIRQYDSNGKYMGTIGREGGGPGEYYRILGMRMLPDGRLAVLDSPHRIALFAADGEYRGDLRIPNSLPTSSLMEYDVAGNIYIMAMEGDFRRPPDKRSFFLAKLSLQGEVLDSIPLPAEERSGKSFLLVTPSERLTGFTTSTRHAWSPMGYLIVGRNDAYSFDIYKPEGIVHVEKRVAPVPVNSEERAEWAAWGKYFERTSTERFPPPPELKPAYKDIYVGEDGLIWVHRHVQAQKRDFPPRAEGDDRPLLTWREPPTFDAFDLDGRFLCTVVLPWDTQVHVWRGRQLWGVQTSDAGEQLVRWRIESVSG